VFFEDECHFKLTLTIIRAWFLAGSLPEIKSSVERFKVSIFGAMGMNGQLITLENETFDAKTFRLFLEKLLREAEVGRNKDGKKEEDKKKITKYYQNNKGRMKYKQYRAIGCGIIGSGAIESAHRTVVQKRMKLSGQRWSIKGAKNMLRLRVISMNKQWTKVIDCLKRTHLAKCA